MVKQEKIIKGTVDCHSCSPVPLLISMAIYTHALNYMFYYHPEYKN